MAIEKYKVSIDRITVAGVIGDDNGRVELQEIANKLGAEWNLKNGAFRLRREYENGDTENLAYFAPVMYHEDKWRLDFNPNRLTDNERLEIVRALALLRKAHFTRLDVAFDVFNNELGMKYRVYRSNVSEREFGVYKGRSKDIQTIYYGSTRSEMQIRQYNKLVERQMKQETIPEGVEHWMRLELQLVGRKPAEWVERAKAMLADFRLPDYGAVENINDRLTLHGLDNGIVDWTDFSDKNKRSRLRKLQHEAYDDTLAVELLAELRANEERLQSELQAYLSDFGIEK